MGRAALDGEAAFKRLAKVVLEEFARLALERIFSQQGGRTTRAANGAALLQRGAARPWALAYLRARRLEGADVAIAWVRCVRIGGDSWAASEPPLGPEAERYRIELLQDGGEIIRSAKTGAPGWTYPAAQQTADFGALPAALTLSVAQIDASGRPGLNTRLTITL